MGDKVLDAAGLDKGLVAVYVDVEIRIYLGGELIKSFKVSGAAVGGHDNLDAQ